MPDESGASDIFGVTPSESSETAEGTETEQTTPESTEGKPIGHEEPLIEPTDEPAPAPWEFKFGPKHFKSPEEAEQYFSTWNGRITRSDRERNEALSALDEWDAWFQTNREKIETALSGKSPASATATPEAAVEPDFVDGISWDYVNDLLEAGKTAEAQKYIAWKTGEQLKSTLEAAKAELKGEFEKKFETSVGPIQEQNAIREMSTQVMLAAQAARDPDHPDVAVFPEFQEGTPTYNPEFCRAFGQVWRQLEASQALRPDLSGVELAYWRTKNLFVQRGESAGDAAQDAIDAETRKFRQSTASRADAVGGGAKPVKTAPGKGKQGTLQDRLFAGMESTARDEVFGTRRK